MVGTTSGEEFLVNKKYQHVLFYELNKCTKPKIRNAKIFSISFFIMSYFAILVNIAYRWIEYCILLSAIYIV